MTRFFTMSGTASSERTAGLALLGGLPDDSLAYADLQPFHLGGVANLEAHAEFFAALVEEEDGEDAVLDDGADEFRCALEEGAEVEGIVQSLGHAEQEAQVGGFDTGVDGIEVIACGWAIVSLQLLSTRVRWSGIGGGFESWI